jgi:hypothetical protein
MPGPGAALGGVLKTLGCAGGSVAPPTSPTLTVAVDGTTVTYTVSGADAGTTNAVYVKAGSAAWPDDPAVTISGNGSASETLEAGSFYAHVISTNIDGLSSIGLTDPIYFSVTSQDCDPVRSEFGTEFFTIDQEYIMDEFWVTATYQQGSTTVEGVYAALGAVITSYDPRLGIDVAIGDSSIWVKPCSLTVDPKMHDRITLSNGHIYEAKAPGALDDERCLLRIPTVRVAY